MIYECKPKRVEIFVNSEMLSAAQVKQRTGCDALINGGLYDMSTFRPVCHLKVDGQVLAKDPYGYWGYGWDTGPDMAMTVDYSGFRNYICCVAMVRNSQPEKMIYQPAIGGARERTMMGMKRDGSVRLVATKSPTTPEQLQQIALEMGLDSAIMLDGGGSTQGISPTDSVVSARRVHNFICIWNQDIGSKDDDPPKPAPWPECPYREPTGYVRLLSIGESARWLQWQLRKHGAGIAVDGIIGPASIAALKKFQASRGLDADGICGPATIQELKK